MSHYDDRRNSSYSHSPPRYPPPSRYPEVQRERSVADRQPYTQLDEVAYRAENAELYPPGYYMNPRKRVRQNGARVNVGGGENRPWDPEIESEYLAFKSHQDAYKVSNTEYTATIKRLRDSEERRGETGRGDRDGSENYDPAIHARLYDLSKGREESAYLSATGRMDHFEKYPRVNRSSRTDESHSRAVETGWNHHATALSNRNTHARLSGPLRMRSY